MALLSPPGFRHHDATADDRNAPVHTLVPPVTLSTPTQKPANMLGLGMPDTLTSPPPQLLTSALVDYPHLGHYLYLLLSTSQGSPPRGQHPLSVSSSGESDGSDGEDATGDADAGADQKTPRRIPMQRTVSSASRTGPGVDKDAFVRKVVEMLDNAEEEEVKEMLRPHMGTHALDELLMDEICLDCMHRRRDDVENVPYAPHLTPTRIRGSPSVNAVVLRPYTPTRLPSFRGRTPLGRPHSPNPGLASGAQTPTLPHGPSALARSEVVSDVALAARTGSPSPPKMLNATAATFSPSPRVVSVPQTTTLGFSPSDPWKDAPVEPVRSASPFGAIGRPAPLSRTNSNLVTATPLFTGQLSPFHTPAGTPHRGTIKIPDVFSSPADANLHRMAARELIPDDDEDDEFSPFGTGLPKLHHHEPKLLNSDAKPFQPFSGSGVLFGSTSTLSSSVPQSDSSFSYDSNGSADSDGHDQTDAAAGMTPLDVLAQVFGSVPRSELEEALHRSGYDFEGAMALLVSQYTQPRSGASTPQRISSPRPLLGVGTRGAIATNHHAPLSGHFVQGGRSFGNMSPGFGGPRSPGGPATRMCRYFLAGECRRSDCRFSHDLDRAMCRFWLRGYCSKGKSCEFLHQFPNKLDASALSSAMSRVELSSDGSAHPTTPGGNKQHEEFPELLTARLGRQSRFDPSRNRFANAVKRATPAPIHVPSVQIGGARFSPAVHSTNQTSPIADSRVLASVPRASPRLKLRVAMLLPTLLTGAAANEQYMRNRGGAITLGNARNACLARAADAFRRGDGAAAKRFSREGKSLNERMLNEAADAAQSLVRDRRGAAQQAIRERDPAWSDDPGDRSARGKECAGGLGVIMGVASAKHVPGGDRLSADERTECLLDLHTLHGQEGSDILLQFLAELEKENFRGLAYVVVGDGKHVGAQDPLRGASKVRLGTSVKQSLGDWGYAWNESGGVLCVDACRV